MGKILDRHMTPATAEDAPRKGDRTIGGFVEAFGYLAAGAGVVCLAAALIKSGQMFTTLLIAGVSSISSGVALIGIAEGLKRLRSLAAEVASLRGER